MPFDLLKCIIILSLCGSMITLILFLFLPLTKRLFSARWHYISGVTALLFFFLPLSYIQPPATNKLVIDHTAPIHTVVGFSFSAVIVKIGNFPITVQSFHHQVLTPEKSVNVGVIAAILYLAVAASLASIKRYKHACFYKNLRRISNPVEPGREITIFQSTLNGLYIRRRIMLYSYAEPGSPFITGLIHPAVFISESTFDLSDQEMKLIFYHELTHYKRGDLMIKSLCSFACLLHWFNPIIHLLRNWLNRSSEIVSIADKGAITASGTMSVELISKDIVINIVKYAHAKGVSVERSSKPKHNIAPYAIGATYSGNNWYTNFASRIKALANDFTVCNGNGQKEYVIYLDKTGHPHTIVVNDSNLKKAKAGKDPIPD